MNGICGLAVALAHDNAAEAQAAIISGGPLNGLSYYELMQDLMEQLSFCMTDGGDTVRGGWVYGVTSSSDGGRDGSSQQWPCLFFRGAIDVHGIEPADWVKDGIDLAYRGLQNANGAIGYRANNSWLNSGKTSGALVAWDVAGRESTYAPAQNALNYLGAQYYEQGGWNPPQGWAGYFYAMYAMKKALSLMEIDSVPTAQGPRVWYDDMCAWLLGQTPDAVHATINPGRRNLNYAFGQHPDGRWTGAEYYDLLGPAYATSHGILILTRGVTVPVPVAAMDDFTGGTGAVAAGNNIPVSGAASFHQGAPNFVINQYQWILRPDDGAGNPVGALDWGNPDYTGVNIVLDRDPGDAGVDGLLPGTYHLTLRVRDDANPAQFGQTTTVFEANNNNQPPTAVPIPPGQLAYTGEFVPGGSVQVQLDGSHSFDIDGDAIGSYAWDLDGDGEFNDPEDQALADDATSATPILTFGAAANVEVGLQVCSVDEFGVEQCSANVARVNIFVTEFDLFVTSLTASDLVLGVSADILVEFGSDLAAPLSGVQVRLYDGLPPAYGGSGIPLGGVNTVDFADAGGGNFTASLFVDDLVLGEAEEVFAFLDSNTAVPEYNETQSSNVASVNVAERPPIAIAQDVTVPADANCQGEVSAEQLDNGSFDPDGELITLSVSPEGPYPLGETEVTLTVTNESGDMGTDTATVTVVDVTPPVFAGLKDAVLNAPAGGTANATSNLAGISATDKVDGLVPYTCTFAGGGALPAGNLLPVGVHQIECSAQDAAGNVAVAALTIVVVEIYLSPHARPLDLISLRNDPVAGPGLPAGATISVIQRAYLNNSDEIIYSTTLAGAGSNNAAVFKGTLASQSVIAVKNTDAGVGNYGNFSNLALNDASDAAFQSLIGGKTGHFLESGAAPDMAAMRGAIAPTGGGEIFGTLQKPALTSGGELLTRANLVLGSGAGVTIDDDTLITSSGNTVIVREGSVSSIGATDYGQLHPRVAASEDNNRFVFSAFLLETAGFDPLDNTGLFSGTLGGGLPALVARENDLVPGLTGVTIQQFLGESVNSSGDLAFRATIGGTGVDSGNNGTLWASIGGVSTLIAREGEVAPCLPNTLVAFDRFRTIHMNDDGSVCFKAFLRDAGPVPAVNSANDGSVWCWKGGSLHLIAREGDIAHNTDGAVIRSIDAFASSGTGGIVYSVSYLPGLGDCVSRNNLGVYLDRGAGDAAAELIVRRNDTFEMDGDTRKVVGVKLSTEENPGGGTGGYGRVINDAGHVLLNLTVSGNQSGIFVLSP